MSKTQLILVGGFLGAGKTTLLAQASNLLAQRGKKVALIANDQAANLVDSAVLRENGTVVEEVAGGCFCCKFTDLMSVIERLVERVKPDVIIGEPVGSCTDLSATVLQPIKQLHAKQYRLSPFSVLIDVRQVLALEGLRLSLGQSGKERFPENVLYIYRKQIEEADALVLNKADLLPPGEIDELRAMLAHEFPAIPLFTISALDGFGVDEWLDYVMSDRPTGHTIAEVDYDRYAEGEAALGWLNATIRLSAIALPDWKQIAIDLLEALRDKLHASRAEIAHLKVFLQSGNLTVAGNLTNNNEPVFLRATGAASAKDTTAGVFVNARVLVDPQLLRTTLEQCLSQIIPSGTGAQITSLESFSPAKPQPENRFSEVVR
jgi:G3E family GTPase